jgi:hypothetical protein
MGYLGRYPMVMWLFIISGIHLIYVNKWYHSTFLGQRRGEFFGSFCRFFLGKKRAAHFRFRSEKKLAEFGQKNWIFEFLSEKYPI